MIEAIEIAGAFAILAAYAANQAGRLTPDRIGYQLLNLVGATALGVIAGIERRPGFFVLETVWAALSLLALARLTLTKRRA